jgi:hypothetical protein
MGLAGLICSQGVETLWHEELVGIVHCIAAEFEIPGRSNGCCGKGFWDEGRDD